MRNAIFLALIFLANSVLAEQSVDLKAYYDKSKAVIKLNWNMVNTNTRTGYILLKSTDGQTWSEVSKETDLDSYKQKGSFFYDDRLFTPGNKNSYRIRIFDQQNNTVALSPIVAVTPNAPMLPSPAAITPNNGSWIIYPNPVNDVLTLNYKGSEPIKGIINVQITDMTGKVVSKFRAASTNTSVQITLSSNLKSGMYAVQMIIENEMVFSSKFLKQ